MKDRVFNLRLWFAVSAFVIISLICTLAAIGVSSFLTNSLLERETEVSQEFLESIVEVEGQTMFYDDGGEKFVPSAPLLEFAKHIISMPGVFRTNIHSTKGRILWSTEKSIVGKIFLDNAELNEALQGKRISEISSLTEHNKPEHLAIGTTDFFIEAYIPIRTNFGKGPVIGVVEFYKISTALDETIKAGQKLVWFSAGLAGLLLLLPLYWIVQRGARIIETQQNNMAQMEAFAAIGQMSSAVAHSLRNPMAAIRSSAELWRSELPQDQRYITEDVIREVDRMDVYVRDLLSYASSDTYAQQPVDPLVILQESLAKQSSALQRHGVAVEIKDGRAAQGKILGEALLLEQALASLITNAIDAMPQGGTLTVRLDAIDEGKLTRIAIQDTGHGISPEHLARATQSYFTTKTRGLGLGLVLAKSIIQRFGGRLDLSSERNAGTQAIVDLKTA